MQPDIPLTLGEFLNQYRDLTDLSMIRGSANEFEKPHITDTKLCEIFSRSFLSQYEIDEDDLVRFVSICIQYWYRDYRCPGLLLLVIKCSIDDYDTFKTVGCNSLGALYLKADAIPLSFKTALKSLCELALEKVHLKYNAEQLLSCLDRIRDRLSQ